MMIIKTTLFVLVWSFTGALLQAWGLESNAAYMLVGSAFGMLYPAACNEREDEWR